MIGPVRGRSAFRQLHLDGHGVRTGGVRVTYRVPDRSDDDDVRVAYAIPRAVGPAVVRNRLRRRLRHLLPDLDPGLLRPGTYLFHLSPATAASTYQELSDTVIRALERLRAAR